MKNQLRFLDFLLPTMGLKTQEHIDFGRKIAPHSPQYHDFSIHINRFPWNIYLINKV